MWSISVTQHAFCGNPPPSFPDEMLTGQRQVRSRCYSRGDVDAPRASARISHRGRGRRAHPLVAVSDRWHPSCPRRPVRQRRQPGHAGLPAGRDASRGARRVLGGRHRDGYSRRARHLDARDREDDALAEGARRRLRRPTGVERGLCGRGHRPGGGRARDGTADEHRLVDSDLVDRREHRLGPCARR